MTARPLGWRGRDWFNKRLPAWLNLRLLGRAFRFRHADRVLTALAADLRRLHPDRVIFSGDATALGFEAELARAAQILGLAGPDPLPGLAVPGNHDYCTRDAASGGCFEGHFRPWLGGSRLDGSLYPFAQRAGPVWLVGVNTSTPNLWPWDASGAVGPEQLERLRALLRTLDAGPRVLVTHYPVCKADARPERRSHGLRDLDELVAVAKEGEVCLWLHGHRHDPYHFQGSGLAPFPVVCAGSATQTGLWSYGVYEIEGRVLRGRRRVYDPAAGGFRDDDPFRLRLGA